MKKLVILAVGAILLLGVLALAAVLLVGEGSDPAPATGPGPGSNQPSGPSASSPSVVAAEAPGAAREDKGYPPGPRRLQLPPGKVKIALSEPLVACFKAHPPHSSLPGVLTLDLEAQAGGGFAVLDSKVKSWGGATAGLVECAQRTLRGQIVLGTSYPAGALATYDFELDLPPSIAPPPPPDPAPSTLPSNRSQQPARRGGASR